MAVLIVPPYLQFFDSDGVTPLSGGKVYTYTSTGGTFTTPKATYTDAGGGTSAPNPVILDARGIPQTGSGGIWGSGTYDLNITDSAGVSVGQQLAVTSFTALPASSTAYFQTFSGTGAQTAFTTSTDLGTDEKAILVWVDAGAGKGYEIQNITAYTISGTTLTFSVAPASGTNNIYVSAPSTLVGAASSAAAAAEASASAALVSEGLAEDWASKTNGIVDSTDYSSKAYAIGGTGVTSTSGKGAAKEWATTTGAAVDTSEYSSKEYATGTTVAVGSAKQWATKTSAAVDTTFSSKEYAQGTQAATGGSAKNWAQQTGADVTGASVNSRSAKSWSQDNLAGATLGGSAKDWAQSASLPDGTNKSAKSYASDASTSASAASTAQTNAETAETNAETAETNAEAAQALAEAAALSINNKWTYSTTTTMADPGTGLIRLDNATIGSATAIAISALTADTGNPNLRTWIASWDDSTNTNRGTITITKSGTPATFAVFTVSGALTDNTTWLQLAVTYVTGSGTFSNSDTMFIRFARAGDKGADGVGTGDFSSNTSTSVDSEIVVFSGTGGKTGKRFTGSGLVLATSGVASVTAPTSAGVMIGNGSGAPTTVAPGTSGNVLTSNGSAWASTAPAAGGSLILLSTQTASASATIDFTSLLTSTYKRYIVLLESVVPATDGATLWMRISTDNSTYDTGASYDHALVGIQAGSSVSGYGGAGQTKFLLNVQGSVGNDTGESYSGHIEISDPANTALYKKISVMSNYRAANANACTDTGTLYWKGTADAILAIRFLMDAGNITSGIFKLYGVL